MKFVLPNAKLGDRLNARVVEIISATELIASFNGDLLRISNQSKQKLGVGQSVELTVTAVKPLQFSLKAPAFRAGLDVSV